MITAHLPAGYVAGRLGGFRGQELVAMLIGATWPDLDLLFFYFVDGRAFHHHRYWVHAPAFAIVTTIVLLVVARALAPNQLRTVAAFGAGWMLHILLDSLAGSIMWLWPASDTLYALVDVPPSQPHWILSFLLHWTFVAELAIWTWAILLLRRQPSSPG